MANRESSSSAEAVWRLLGPHVTPDNAELERRAIYTVGGPHLTLSLIYMGHAITVGDDTKVLEHCGVTTGRSGRL